MSEFSKSKQALLASGLPLEMGVEQLLRSMNFGEVSADFVYWRRSELGHKDFSSMSTPHESSPRHGSPRRRRFHIGK